jgi:hypothetical protein
VSFTVEVVRPNSLDPQNEQAGSSTLSMTVAIAVPPWNGTVEESRDMVRWLTVDPSQVTRSVLGMVSPPAAWAIVRPFAWSTETASPSRALVTGLPSIALTSG